MRRIHYFDIEVEKPANEIGFRWRGIGDGKRIFRWDKERVYPSQFGYKQHFIDSRIGNYKVASKLPFRVELGTYHASMIMSVFNQWVGSCESEFMTSFFYTGTEWKQYKTGKIFANLFRAIRWTVRNKSQFGY